MKRSAPLPRHPENRRKAGSGSSTCPVAVFSRVDGLEFREGEFFSVRSVAQLAEAVGNLVQDAGPDAILDEVKALSPEDALAFLLPMRGHPAGETAMRVLLRVPALAPGIVEHLLSSLPEMDSAVNGDGVNVARLTLLQLRWMPLPEPAEAAELVVQALEASEPAMQREVLASLPEIVEEAQYPAILPALAEALSEDAIVSSVVDCLAALALPPPATRALAGQVLQRLAGASPSMVPSLLRLLLSILDGSTALPALRALRHAVRVEAITSSGTGAVAASQGVHTAAGAASAGQGSGSGAPDETGQEWAALAADALRRGLRTRRDIAVVWLKAVDTMESASHVVVLDVWIVLSLLTVQGMGSKAEAVLRRMLRGRLLTPTKLQRALALAGGAALASLPHIVQAARALMTAPAGAAQRIARDVYSLAFRTTSDRNVRRQVVDALLAHASGADPKAVSAGLETLRSLAADPETLQHLRHFAPFLLGMLDHVDGCSLEQLRHVFSVLASVAYGRRPDREIEAAVASPHASEAGKTDGNTQRDELLGETTTAGNGAEKGDAVVDAAADLRKVGMVVSQEAEELDIVVRKLLTQRSARRQCIGVVGSVAIACTVAHQTTACLRVRLRARGIDASDISQEGMDAVEQAALTAGVRELAHHLRRAEKMVREPSLFGFLCMELSAEIARYRVPVAALKWIDHHFMALLERLLTVEDERSLIDPTHPSRAPVCVGTTSQALVPSYLTSCGRPEQDMTAIDLYRAVCEPVMHKLACAIGPLVTLRTTVEAVENPEHGAAESVGMVSMGAMLPKVLTDGEGETKTPTEVLHSNATALWLTVSFLRATLNCFSSMFLTHPLIMARVAKLCEAEDRLRCIAADLPDWTPPAWDAELAQAVAPSTRGGRAKRGRPCSSTLKPTSAIGREGNEEADSGNGAGAGRDDEDGESVNEAGEDGGADEESAGEGDETEESEHDAATVTEDGSEPAKTPDTRKRKGKPLAKRKGKPAKKKGAVKGKAVKRAPTRRQTVKEDVFVLARERGQAAIDALPPLSPTVPLVLGFSVPLPGSGREIELFSEEGMRRFISPALDGSDVEPVALSQETMTTARPHLVFAPPQYEYLLQHMEKLAMELVDFEERSARARAPSVGPLSSEFATELRDLCKWTVVNVVPLGVAVHDRTHAVGDVLQMWSAGGAFTGVQTLLGRAISTLASWQAAGDGDPVQAPSPAVIHARVVGMSAVRTAMVLARWLRGRVESACAMRMGTGFTGRSGTATAAAAQVLDDILTGARALEMMTPQVGDDPPTEPTRAATAHAVLWHAGYAAGQLARSLMRAVEGLPETLAEMGDFLSAGEALVGVSRAAARGATNMLDVAKSCGLTGSGPSSASAPSRPVEVRSMRRGGERRLGREGEIVAAMGGAEGSVPGTRSGELRFRGYGAMRSDWTIGTWSEDAVRRITEMTSVADTVAIGVSQAAAAALEMDWAKGGLKPIERCRVIRRLLGVWVSRAEDPLEVAEQIASEHLARFAAMQPEEGSEKIKKSEPLPGVPSLSGETAAVWFEATMEEATRAYNSSSADAARDVANRIQGLRNKGSRTSVGDKFASDDTATVLNRARSMRFPEAKETYEVVGSALDHLVSVARTMNCLTDLAKRINDPKIVSVVAKCAGAFVGTVLGNVLRPVSSGAAALIDAWFTDADRLSRLQRGMKALQHVTRHLQAVCDDSKAQVARKVAKRATSSKRGKTTMGAARRVPQVRQMLERVLFLVKAAVDRAGVGGLYVQKNLKHRGVDGKVVDAFYGVMEEEDDDEQEEEVEGEEEEDADRRAGGADVGGGDEGDEGAVAMAEEDGPGGVEDEEGGGATVYSFNPDEEGIEAGDLDEVGDLFG